MANLNANTNMNANIAPIIETDEDIDATKVELANIIRKQDLQIQALHDEVATVRSEQGMVLAHSTIRYIAIGIFLWWVSTFLLPWAYSVAMLFTYPNG